MHKEFREIESPLSAFNNFQLHISDRLNDVVYGQYSRIKAPNQLTMKSELIFNSDYIILMGFMRLYNDRNIMKIKVLKEVSSEELEILTAIKRNFLQVETLLFQYIQMYNRIAAGYNDVPNGLLNNIVNMIEHQKYHDILLTSSFLIPYKSKVGAKLEGNDMIFMEKLYNRYEYVLRFQPDTKNQFIYTIQRVLSSDLNENKSLENVRFVENDVMHRSTVRIDDAERFVINLFCYGVF
jgi:hypothetical protein